MQANMKYMLKQHFQIESARHLPRLEKNHPCHRIHGHSFKITLILVGEKNTSQEWVIDYNEIVSKAQPWINQLDHQMLNNISGLENPTTENLCSWLYEKIKPTLPLLHQVEISETANSVCIYPAY